MSTVADEFRVALMTLMENMAGIREVVGGYRKQLEDDGFSAHDAGRMCVDLHAYLLAVLRSQTTSST